MEILRLALEVLSGIPATFWSAITAALIALIATSRSNANARRMLAMQLTNANEQAEAKRSLDLRREVFVPAVKAASESMVLLARVVDTDSEESEIVDAWQRVQAELSAIHVVASEETVKAAIAYNNFLGRAMTDLNLLRAKIKQTRGMIETLQRIADDQRLEAKVLLEEMREHNLRGGEPQAWERLQRQWGAYKNVQQQADDKVAAESVKLAPLMIEALAAIHRYGQEGIALQTEALLGVRGDLGLPLDTEAYRKTMDESRALMDEAVAKTQAALAANATDAGNSATRPQVGPRPIFNYSAVLTQSRPRPASDTAPSTAASTESEAAPD